MSIVLVVILMLPLLYRLWATLFAIPVALWRRDARPLLWPLYAYARGWFVMTGLVVALLGALPRKWPRLLWPWGDDEWPNWRVWWYGYSRAKYRWLPNDYWRRYFWHAVRNPSQNLKYLLPEGDNVRTTFSDSRLEDIEPRDLRRLGLDQAWRWQSDGALCSFRAVWLDGDSYGELYVGFKLGPNPGTGFTGQFRRRANT